MPHRITRTPKSRETTMILLELIYVMTLAHLHVNFPTCLCLPLGLGVIYELGILEVECFQES